MTPDKANRTRGQMFQFRGMETPRRERKRKNSAHLKKSSFQTKQEDKNEEKESSTRPNERIVIKKRGM